MTLPIHIKNIIENYKENYILKLSNAGLYDEDMDEIVDLINANKNINSVDFSQNNISDIGALKLLNLTNVYALNLSHLSIEDEGAIALVKNPSFVHLNFEGNRGISNQAGRTFLQIATQVHLGVEGTLIASKIQEEIFALTEVNKQKANLMHKKENDTSVKTNGLFSHNSDTAEEAKTIHEEKEETSDPAMTNGKHKHFPRS